MRALTTALRRLRGLVALGAALRHVAGDRRSALKLWLLALVLPLKARLAPRRSVRVHVRALGRIAVCHVGDRSDLIVLREVFGDAAYEPPSGPDPKIIFDLGSNVGISVVWFSLRFPDARIFAFEPDPSTFDRLRQNVDSLAHVTAHRLAVSGEDGERPFYPARESFKSALVATEPGQRSTTVKVRGLDSLMADLGVSHIDLLKIDVEGAEYEVLRNFDGLARVGTIIGELHVDLAPCSRDEFLGLLGGFDVRLEAMPMPGLPGADRWAISAVHSAAAGQPDVSASR